MWSDIVATGTVVGDRKLSNDDSIEADIYTVRLDRVFRGKTPLVIYISSTNDSGRLEMEKGHSYLLFVRRTRKTLVVDNCGNSSEISVAAGAIQKVLAIPSTSSSQIYGAIGGCTFSAIYCPKQASIVAIGNERQYRTTSSADGHFELHVPAGTYEVQIQSADPKCVSFDLVYKNPARIRVPKGGSAGSHSSQHRRHNTHRS